MRFLTETDTVERRANSTYTEVSRVIFNECNTLFDEDEQFEQLSNTAIIARFEQEVADIVRHQIRSTQSPSGCSTRIFRTHIIAVLSYNFNLSERKVSWLLKSTHTLEKIARPYGGNYITDQGRARIEFEENNTCSLTEEVL
jgi:hypothetical protein